MPSLTAAPSHVQTRVTRIEVRPSQGHADPIGNQLRREAAGMQIPLAWAKATHVYLVQSDPRSPIDLSGIERVRTKLLADPVSEVATVGASPVEPNAFLVEVHPLPGVMDPVAQSVEGAIAELLGLEYPPLVATGWRYDLKGEGLTAETARTVALRLLANPVIHRVLDIPLHPPRFPVPEEHETEMRQVPMLALTDDQLVTLSRDAHLFLSLEEMRAVKAHYQDRGTDPREIELETLAQTWSEHCVHKTLKSTVRYVGAPLPPSPTGRPRPGCTLQSDGSVIIANLLKSTVAAATRELIAGGLDWTLSVFVDNSGVIAFDDHTAVCIKVETHNRPSAIEPYGGAATGIGGCIRDVIGTGLGARPIASTDVFCVAPPDMPQSEIPEGCLHPKRILTQVVAGVRDYGNRMGIPTVAGGLYVDPRHVGNPLVFCGCIGVLPRSCVHGQVQTGDLIVALGGKTGRDGIHGATFSSSEIQHTATDEFAHAVQIGNAITEKQVLDAILRARDEHGSPLYSGMTDCGAGGFSSAIGEMGKNTGAIVHLDRAPLKYPGLSATEIWISEAQERMILSVPEKNLQKLQAICDEEGVELAVLGNFSPAPGSRGQNPDLGLYYHGQEVGRLNLHFLHEGIPTPQREALWQPPSSPNITPASPNLPPAGPAPVQPALTSLLRQLLAHPNIASKHWIIRQYDHEVRGQTSLKPLVGPLSRGPGDASVVHPVPGSRRALAIASGLQTGLGDPLRWEERGESDTYVMTLAAIDECVRNLVCVGADPERIAILDNFCWPSCKKPENMGHLVRAAIACYDGALAYRTPFVSGKDSLHNEFLTRDGRAIAIPPTLLITGIGIVPDILAAVTMDAKQPGNVLLLIGDTQVHMAGSHALELLGGQSHSLAGSGADALLPRVDLARGPSTAKAVAALIARGLVASAHDVSDGGVLCSVSEMLLAGSTPEHPIGATLDLSLVSSSLLASAFSESPSRYVLEIDPANLDKVQALLRNWTGLSQTGSGPGQTGTAGISHTVLGTLNPTGLLAGVRGQFETVAVEELAKIWLKPLDF